MHQEIIGRRLINTHQQLSNCIRFLAVDAIARANSGHPGMPLGMADIMTVLFREVLNHDPKYPNWMNRDRLVISNGHGSMLLYAALYLSGYDWDIEEIKNFRQLGSHAAGHPELDISKGVEVTTGPLGQGLANAIGMAISAKRLAKIYGEDKINYHTFCFVGDGCLMEGISHEAASLAPKLVDSGLTVIWDDNGISIDGQIDPWFEQDVLTRFESYGFEVINDVDGHDPVAIKAALLAAREKRKPCFIQMKTKIGKGCYGYEGLAKAHGQPIDQEAIARMRQDLDWSHQPFEIPEELLKLWRVTSSGPKESLPEHQISLNLSDWLANQEESGEATRKASQRVLTEIAPAIPHLIGGSADLTASNLTKLPNPGQMNDHQYDHQYIAYGVREFGMFGIANGLALAGMVPFVATFLTFMDYGRNALRMAALMKLRVVYVLTHDSIGLGEDGPTHQPIEHLSMCRATPGVYTWRPCNLQETVASWMYAMNYRGPTVLALSRQSVGVVERAEMTKVQQGAYFQKFQEAFDVTILATGSEVSIALETSEILEGMGVRANVVSVPCLDLLSSSDVATSLGDRSQVFVIEAGASQSWTRWAPWENIFGVNDFGHSGTDKALYQHFGLVANEVAQKIKSHVE